MRIKVNSFNLGLVYETSIICSADYEDYFKQTASFLEEKYAVKTFLYVYDRDPLTSKVKLILSTCYSNIFMLTAGVAEKAAANENSVFRKVYAYTQKHNPNSISLSQVDKTHIDYTVTFPDDMKSFTWLHRKDYFLGNYTPSMLAEEISREIRLNFSGREQKRFNLFNKTPLYELMFSYKEILVWAALLFFVPVLLYLVSLGLDIEVVDGGTWKKLLIKLLTIVCYIVNIASVAAIAVTPAILITKRLRYFEYRINVSTTFLHFREITVKRLLVLLFLVITVANISTYAFLHDNLQISIGESSLISDLLDYLPLWVLHLAHIADLLLLYILTLKAPHRLSFTRQRKIYAYTVRLAIIATTFVAEYLIITKL